MRKFSWLAVSLAVALSSSFTNVYSKAPSTDKLIVPGRSVGQIAIGMRECDVRNLLGKPTSSDEDCLEYDQKGLTILLNHGEVCEIIFLSKQFATRDGLSLVSFRAKDRYKQFEHAKLPWRFMNVKHDLKSGGLDIFETNIDSADPDYAPSVYGVVFAGAEPEGGLQLDEPGGGWMTWDGDLNSLWEGAVLQDGLFTPHVQSAGTVGRETR